MSEDKLSSWKEIAAYLKCDESTARRWERRNGLPIHRIGSKGGSVYAYPQEIEAWVRAGGLNGVEVHALQEDPKPSVNRVEIERPLPDLSTLNLRPTTVAGQSREMQSGVKWRRYSLFGAIIILGVLGTSMFMNGRGHPRIEAQPPNDSSMPAWRLPPIRADQNSSGSVTHKATNPVNWTNRQFPRSRRL